MPAARARAVPRFPPGTWGPWEESPPQLGAGRGTASCGTRGGGGRLSQNLQRPNGWVAPDHQHLRGVSKNVLNKRGRHGSCGGSAALGWSGGEMREREKRSALLLCLVLSSFPLVLNSADDAREAFFPSNPIF